MAVEELDDGLETGPVLSADCSLTVGLDGVRQDEAELLCGGGDLLGAGSSSSAVQDFRASS